MVTVHQGKTRSSVFASTQATTRLSAPLVPNSQSVQPVGQPVLMVLIALLDALNDHRAHVERAGDRSQKMQRRADRRQRAGHDHHALEQLVQPLVRDTARRGSRLEACVTQEQRSRLGMCAHWRRCGQDLGEAISAG